MEAIFLEPIINFYCIERDKHKNNLNLSSSSTIYTWLESDIFQDMPI